MVTSPYILLHKTRRIYPPSARPYVFMCTIRYSVNMLYLMEKTPPPKVDSLSTLLLPIYRLSRRNRKGGIKYIYNIYTIDYIILIIISIVLRSPKCRYLMAGYIYANLIKFHNKLLYKIPKELKEKLIDLSAIVCYLTLRS